MTKLLLLNKVYARQTGTAIGTSDTAVDYNGVKDYRTVIEFVNSGSSNVVVTFNGKKDGISGVAGTADASFTIPAGTSFLAIDSLPYKVINGANRGKIYMKAATASVITAYVVSLPNA